MPLITTPPGGPNNDSYVATADCLVYAQNHGLLFDGIVGATSTITGDIALRRATQWIDGTYRLRFMGLKVGLRAQPLEWPRYGAADTFLYYVDSTTIPIEIINATCEAACREYTVPGTLSPDLDRGGQVKSLKAGSVDVVYGANATPLAFYTAIDNILNSLLSSANTYYSAGTRG